ncbi:MAG: hypothetical protein IPJ66_10130 [Bacteroidetes bacterium]|nr:hypothetical protein [Bacteroidota bacterium]
MFNIGWVFYSEKQRENLETIISMTQEPGTLDELGLGSVRDGFANLFFPNNNNPDQGEILHFGTMDSQ